MHSSKSPIMKKRDSLNSDCDSMMKTRLPTQSVILTQKKTSSKEKGAYKPWEAKKNHSKIVSTPMISSGLPLSKRVSEQSATPRASNALQKKQSHSGSYVT